MPLTSSHAAAAWPLARLAPQLPLAGFVAGTVAPDLQYFLLLAPLSRTWHAPLGLVAFAIPAGALAWIAWRALVRPAVQALLPPGLQWTLAASRWTGASIAAGVAAVTAGALSHVVWDGLTHRSGWAVGRWDALETVVDIGPVTLPIYKFLQHGSTVLGAALLLMWGLGWWRSQLPAARAFAPGQVTTVFAALGALLGFAALGGGLNALRAPPGLAFRLGYAAVGAMLAITLASLVWGCVHHGKGRRIAGRAPDN